MDCECSIKLLPITFSNHTLMTWKAEFMTEPHVGGWCNCCAQVVLLSCMQCGNPSLKLRPV